MNLIEIQISDGEIPSARNINFLSMCMLQIASNFMTTTTSYYTRLINHILQSFLWLKMGQVLNDVFFFT